MRTDLASAFITAKNAATRSPRQLAVFHFIEAGEVYVSDQPLGAADGLSNEYSALVEDWGELVDMAGGDPADQNASEIRQLTLTLWNGGTTPFCDYFLKEDPEDVLVDIYQWFLGLSDNDKALIDTFVVQDPIEFNEASHLLRLDLLSLGIRYDNPIGDLLNTDDWPTAKTEDIGKGIDLIIGSPGEIKTVCAKTTPIATLNGSILSGTPTITAHENLNDLDFSTSGYVQIGEEKMNYTSRTSSAFNVAVRGCYPTEATEHLDGDQITEVIDDYTYLAGKGPVSSISNVKVAGIPAPAGIYTAYPDSDPARIEFTEKPYANQYAKGSRFLEMQFDAVNDENTAYQPHYAYDAAANASAAKINPDNPKLSVRQVTENPNRGEIVKAYLAVEHWESAVFLSDYVEVSITGIAVLGRLSRPNPADVIDIDAAVDIDHGHSHHVGDEHTHPFTDPTIATEDPTHTHEAEGLTTVIDRYAYDTTPFGLLYGPYEVNAQGREYITVWAAGCPEEWDTLSITVKIIGDSLRVEMSAYGDLGVFGSNWFGRKTCIEGTHTYGFGPGKVSDGKVMIRFRTYGTGVMNAHIFVSKTGFKLEFIVNAGIIPKETGVTAGISTSGSNAEGGDKESDDVDDLATDNVPVEVAASEAATRSIVNLFDVTDYVNFDWDWFTNKDIVIEYLGSGESKNVYILHAFFDVEYRKKEIVFSDDVTAEVAGLIDDASGTYTGTPNALITRPDHVRKYLLCHRGGLPAAYIDSAGFSTAGNRYLTLGYQFDGVLDANLTVREVEKKLARQCRSRFFWNAGKAKIALREKTTDWSVDAELSTSDLRLKTISARRQRVSDIVNTIQLFYARDWTSDKSDANAYKDSVNDLDTDSVTKHGTCEKREDFLFDCVSDATMAADLVDYYLDLLAAPSTFYEFEAYLAQFDIEKEDIVTITSNQYKIRKARMACRALNRVFGSGKTKRINAVRIIAECIRYFLIEGTISDTVKAMDQLSLTLEFDLDLAEMVHVIDDITVEMNVAENDTVDISDVLSIIADFNPQISETITASDVLAFAMTVPLEDEVKIADYFDVWRTHGFGGGGFGVVGFGGYNKYFNRQPDEVQAWDVLSMAISTHIGYRSGATYGFGQVPFGSSEFGDYPEKVKVTDELLFSDGFGGPKFGGFGQAPFGR